MTDISTTIAQRQSTHGSFADNANCSQQLKDVMRMQLNWPKLTPVQRESLEMFATKVSRILTGNNNEPDHWHDISGYASLAEGEIDDAVIRLPPVRNIEDELLDEETIALAARLAPTPKE